MRGGDEKAVQIPKSFRLTRKSVENIGRCLGMRTCGEAVDLFVERTEEQPSETPSGECPHGHQEAAFAYMMYGIEPTEPMPYLRRSTHLRQHGYEPGVLLERPREGCGRPGVRHLSRVWRGCPGGSGRGGRQVGMGP